MSSATIRDISRGGVRLVSVMRVDPGNLPSGSQTATVVLNPRGNPLNVTDPTGAQSSATFNNSQAADKDLPDTVTQTRRNSDNTTTNFTTQVSYDAKGEVTSATDPTGAVTRVTYGPFGQVVTTSDALGDTVTNTYDKNGNLMSLVSGAARRGAFPSAHVGGWETAAPLRAHVKPLSAASGA